MSFALALVVLMLVGSVSSTTQLPEALRAATIGAAWQGLALLGFAVLAGPLGVLGSTRRSAIAVAVVSVVAAAGISFAYGAWAAAHHGTLDPDVLGIGVLMPAAAIAATAFAGVRPLLLQPAARFAIVVAATAIAVLVAMAVANLPGLADGISSEGIVMAGAGCLICAVVAWAWRLPVAQHG